MFMLWKVRGVFMRFVNGEREKRGREERRREERIEERIEEEEDMGGFHDDNKSTN